MSCLLNIYQKLQIIDYYYQHIPRILHCIIQIAKIPVIFVQILVVLQKMNVLTHKHPNDINKINSSKQRLNPRFLIPNNITISSNIMESISSS